MNPLSADWSALLFLWTMDFLIASGMKHFHKRNVSSAPAETTVVLSGEMARCSTLSVWPKSSAVLVYVKKRKQFWSKQCGIITDEMISPSKGTSILSLHYEHNHGLKPIPCTGWPTITSRLETSYQWYSVMSHCYHSTYGYICQLYHRH